MREYVWEDYGKGLGCSGKVLGCSGGMLWAGFGSWEGPRKVLRGPLGAHYSASISEEKLVGTAGLAQTARLTNLAENDLSQPRFKV